MGNPTDELYLLQNGQQVGPFPATAVRSMLESGSLTPEDLVWYEGLPEWRALSTLFPGIGPVSNGTTARASTSGNLPREETFWSLIQDSFSYPFRGDGFIILLTGAIFFTILGALGNLPGIFSLTLRLFYMGYTASMLQNVLNGSGQGESVLPKWPDFTDWQSDIIDPALKWVGTFALVLGPGIATLFFNRPAGFAVLGLGVLYLPMAFMLVGMFDSLAALSPALGFKSIFSIFGHYVLTLIVLGVLTVMNYLTGELGDAVTGIGPRIFASFVDGFNHLYTLVLFTRILGCLYRVNRRTLGWF